MNHRDAYFPVHASRPVTQLVISPAPGQRRSCNKHSDCDEADRLSRAAGGGRATHCYVEDCEDCFGC